MKKIRGSISRILALAVVVSLFITPMEWVNAASVADSGEKGEQKEVSAENTVQNTETPDNVVENEIIVVYDDAGVSEKKSENIQEAAQDALADMDIEVTKEVAESSEEQGTVVTAEIPEGMGLEEAIEEVAKDENVSYAQPNYKYEFLENIETEEPEIKDQTSDAIQINDPYKDEYYLKNTKVLDAWQEVQCNKNVTVAVLDSGCRMDHEDLQGNLLKEYAYDAYYDRQLTSASAPNGGDPQGHGTHVSGLIAAEANNEKGIAGTSYNANLLPVKLCDNSGGGMTTETLLRAMKYCAGLINEKKVKNLRVMNISAGYYSSGTEDVDLAVEDEIEILREEYGILCVCAGGNGDEKSQAYTAPLYPSDYDACFSVTALDSNGNNCVWSDYNSAKDISAPGTNILSTFNFSNNSYQVLSGTSMATPIVSGICALLWAKNPDLTVQQVVAAIESTAEPVKSSAIDGRAEKSGSHGAINAVEALKYWDSGDQLIDIGAENVNATVELSFCETAFSGKRITPEPTVKLGDTVLIKNKDYKVSYKNNVNVGTAKAIVTGLNGYCGSITKEFTINKAKISSKNAGFTYRISSKNNPYTGAAVRPAIMLLINGKVLKQGEEYSITYYDNVEVGQATIIVEGLERNISGKGKISFNIIKADLEDLAVSLSSSSYTYNKKAKKPKVTVKNISHTPVSGRDYKVSYSNNVKVGTATVKITGMGSHYTGTVKKTFKINPKGTSISKLTKKTKGFKAKWKKQSTQTTGYQIQYSTSKNFKSAKTKTVKKTKTTSTSITKIKKKKTYYVRVRTYKTVEGKKYYSAWSKTKKVKTK